MRQDSGVGFNLTSERLGLSSGQTGTQMMGQQSINQSWSNAITIVSSGGGGGRYSGCLNHAVHSASIQNRIEMDHE